MKKEEQLLTREEVVEMLLNDDENCGEFFEYANGLEVGNRYRLRDLKRFIGR